MNWFRELNFAIDYIEDHITEEIDYEILAEIAYSSKFHFQRVFAIACGVTVGEYIRKRRLTLAGSDLTAKHAKVLDVAIKYGYKTSESFSRAFFKFHNMMPSKVKKGCALKVFPKITLSDDGFGCGQMEYEIKEIEERILVGFKKRFTGVPYGEDRARQEEAFFCSTRAKQWLLLGASCEYSTDYCIVTNMDDDGYDFYIAYELDEWTRKELFNSQTTGIDFIDKFNYETVVIPKQTYAIFKTGKQKRPIKDYEDIRRRITVEWLPSVNYVLAEGAEVVALRWRSQNGLDWKSKKYVEIQLPVQTKK